MVDYSHDERYAQPAGVTPSPAMGESLAAAARSAIARRGQSADVIQFRDGPTDGAAVHEAARKGLSGDGGPLPHGAAIQRSFGKHDVSHVRAHVGGAAADASKAIGGRAYAMGDRVAFRSAPDLHTAAHEAAHVVQQQGGVQLAGGVGRAGDRYEQHADAVADAVVAGRSAEALLDRYAGAGGASDEAVQRVDYTAAESAESVAHLRRLLGGGSPEDLQAAYRALWQVASSRVEMAESEAVAFSTGADRYDLQLIPTDVDAMLDAFEARVSRAPDAGGAERAGTEGAQGNQDTEDTEDTEGGHGNEASGDTDDALWTRFAFGSDETPGFNREFQSILHAFGLRAGGRAQAGPRAGTRSGDDQTVRRLAALFTPWQRDRLLGFFADRLIPERLFNGDEVGNTTAQQRLLMSGHILSEGRYRPAGFTQKVHANMCFHWVQIVHHYAGVTPATGASRTGVAGTLDHSGQVVTGSGRSTAIHSDYQRRVAPEDLPARETPGGLGPLPPGSDHAQAYEAWRHARAVLPEREAAFEAERDSLEPEERRRRQAELRQLRRDAQGQGYHRAPSTGGRTP